MHKVQVYIVGQRLPTYFIHVIYGQVDLKIPVLLVDFVAYGLLIGFSPNSQVVLGHLKHLAVHGLEEDLPVAYDQKVHGLLESFAEQVLVIQAGHGHLKHLAVYGLEEDLAAAYDQKIHGLLKTFAALGLVVKAGHEHLKRLAAYGLAEELYVEYDQKNQVGHKL